VGGSITAEHGGGVAIPIPALLKNANPHLHYSSPYLRSTRSTTKYQPHGGMKMAKNVDQNPLAMTMPPIQSKVQTRLEMFFTE
jgi:hypothetical protein